MANPHRTPTRLANRGTTGMHMIRLPIRLSTSHAGVPMHVEYTRP